MAGKDDLERVLKLYTVQMDAQINRFNEIVLNQAVAIGKQAVNMSRLEHTVSEEVLPVIKEIPSLVEHGIRLAQDTCPLYKAWTNKEKKDVGNKLSTLFDSKPPPPFKKGIFRIPTAIKVRLIEAIIVLILAVAAWLGSHYYYCNGVEVVNKKITTNEK